MNCNCKPLALAEIQLLPIYVKRRVIQSLKWQLVPNVNNQLRGNTTHEKNWNSNNTNNTCQFLLENEINFYYDIMPSSGVLIIATSFSCCSGYGFYVPFLALMVWLRPFFNSLTMVSVYSYLQNFWFSDEFVPKKKSYSNS